MRAAKRDASWPCMYVYSWNVIERESNEGFYVTKHSQLGRVLVFDNEIAGGGVFNSYLTSICNRMIMNRPPLFFLSYSSPGQKTFFSPHFCAISPPLLPRYTLRLRVQPSSWSRHSMSSRGSEGLGKAGSEAAQQFWGRDGLYRVGWEEKYRADVGVG